MIDYSKLTGIVDSAVSGKKPEGKKFLRKRVKDSDDANLEAKDADKRNVIGKSEDDEDGEPDDNGSQIKDSNIPVDEEPHDVEEGAEDPTDANAQEVKAADSCVKCAMSKDEDESEVENDKKSLGKKVKDGVEGFAKRDRSLDHNWSVDDFKIAWILSEFGKEGLNAVANKCGMQGTGSDADVATYIINTSPASLSLVKQAFNKYETGNLSEDDPVFLQHQLNSKAFMQAYNELHGKSLDECVASINAESVGSKDADIAGLEAKRESSRDKSRQRGRELTKQKSDLKDKVERVKSAASSYKMQSKGKMSEAQALKRAKQDNNWTDEDEALAKKMGLMDSKGKSVPTRKPHISDSMKNNVNKENLSMAEKALRMLDSLQAPAEKKEVKKTAKVVDDRTKPLNGDNNPKLQQILKKMASEWGAKPLYIDIYPDSKEVIFWFNEHGEEFPSSLDFADVEAKYGLSEEDILKGAVSDSKRRAGKVTDGIGKAVPTRKPHITDGKGKAVPTRKPHITDGKGKAVPTRKPHVSKEQIADAIAKYETAHAYATFKVTDSYINIKKRIADALEDTETTDDAINVAIEALNEVPAEQAVAAVIEVLSEAIDILQSNGCEDGTCDGVSNDEALEDVSADSSSDSVEGAEAAQMADPEDVGEDASAEDAGEAEDDEKKEETEEVTDSAPSDAEIDALVKALNADGANVSKAQLKKAYASFKKDAAIEDSVSVSVTNSDGETVTVDSESGDSTVGADVPVEPAMPEMPGVPGEAPMPSDLPELGGEEGVGEEPALGEPMPEEGAEEGGEEPALEEPAL